MGAPGTHLHTCQKLLPFLSLCTYVHLNRVLLIPSIIIINYYWVQEEFYSFS